jgi:hypothetical protein
VRAQEACALVIAAGREPHVRLLGVLRTAVGMASAWLHLRQGRKEPAYAPLGGQASHAMSGGLTAQTIAAATANVDPVDAFATRASSETHAMDGQAQPLRLA